LIALLVLLVLVNFAISALNAWSVGKVWPERRDAPWSAKLVIWAAAAMSACGFTWCYLLVLAAVVSGLRHATFLAHVKQLKFVTELPPTFLPAMLNLGYLIIIIPILGSGLVLMVQSWAVAYRKRTFGSVGVAGWNTFANVYNYYEAVQAVPQAIQSVIGFFSSDDDEDNSLLVMLVVGALCLGIFTTAMVVRWSARNHVNEMEQRRDRVAAQAGVAPAGDRIPRYGAGPQDTRGW